jgi:alpha-ketoglutarate-dependent taurine dioxygenase
MRMAEICLDVVDHPSAWRAADMADESAWTITLDDHHVDELDNALAGVRDRPYDAITRDDFSLPTFSKVLDDVVDIVENGRGFVVLRGIPVERHELDDVRRLYFGLSTYVGRATPQTKSGEMMVDVMVYPDNTSDRGFTHSKGLPFHSDTADILALLCLAAPESGGLSSVTSAVSVHNHILTHHPELLGLLYKEYCYDKGEAGGDDRRYFRSQIFGYFEGRLACRYYSRMRLEAAPALTGIPVSPVEIAALDLFEATAADPEFRHDFTLRPGNLLLLSNTYGLHSRTPFDDGPNQHRHLLRLALNPYQQRAFPAGFAPWRDGLL